MKKIWKKIASFLMSVAIVMMMSGLVAFAAENDPAAKIGNQGYDTLQAAVDAAADGATIQLQKAVTENVTVAAGKNITLDLNNCTLSGGKATDNRKPALLNNGTMTIKDSGEKGTIKREDEGYRAHYVIDNQGTMTIESGTFYNNSGGRNPNTNAYNGASLIRNAGRDVAATLIIKGGHFEQNNFIVIKNDDLGILTVTGGTLISENESTIQNWSNATLSGGTVKGLIWTMTWSDDFPGSVTTLKGDVIVEGMLRAEVDGTDTTTIPKVQIENGQYDVTWKISDDADVKVVGGTFTAAVPEEYCAEGFTSVKDENGNFTVASSAKIGDTKYGTLQKAIEAAKPGDTVELLCNVTVSTKDVTRNTGVINIDKDINIKGNGYTISAEGDKADVHVINVMNGAKVSIENLTIDGGDVFKHGVQAYTAPGSANQTSVSLNNVTIKKNAGYGVVVNASKVDAVDLYTEGNGWGGVNVDSQSAAAAFDITSGKISEEYSVVVESEDDGKTSTTISGGTFVAVGMHSTEAKGEDTIIISGGTFGTPVPEEYCAENFKPVKNSDNTYSVLPELQVTAKGYTGKYDGKAHGITVKAEDGAKITYSTKENGKYTTDMPACIYAGTYQIYYKAEKDGRSETTGSATVIIEKKAVTITAKDQSITIGSDIKTGVTEVLSEGLVEGDQIVDIALTMDVTAATKGGKITPSNAVIKAASKDVTENYEIKYVQGTLTVNKSSFNVSAENYVGTYDGKAHSITVIVPEGAKVTYATKKEGPYTETNPSFTEVGTYVVYYKVETEQKTIAGEASVIIEAEKALTKSVVEKNESALNVKMAAAWKGSSIQVKWGKVSGAKGYDIYVQECSKSFSSKNIAKSVNAGTTSAIVTKVSGKKINTGKNYKVVVRPYRMANGKKEYIGKSLSMHFASKNSKVYTDAKKVTLAKRTFTLKKGAKAVLKAKITKKSSKKKLLSKGHGASLRYWSTNKKVATVTSSGKVKAVGKGSCYVYVTSLNGVKARAKITVK